MDSSANNDAEGTSTEASDRISVKKFAEIIDRSYPNARRMIAEGKVEAIKIGSRYMISMQEVHRFLSFGNRKPD